MTERVLKLAIHPSEFPAKIRASILNGLKQGRIPGRLLYQSPSQAQRWLDYHQAYSPSRTDNGLRKLYGAACAAAIAHLGAQPLVAVSLGCGGGHKDGDLFDEVPHEPRGRSHYVPVDTSPALVVEALLHVTGRHAGLATHPLVADLEAEPDLRGWLDGEVPVAHPRLFCAFGLLPNLDPDALLAYLRHQLRPGDALLLSANLSPRGLAADGARILAQYDNAPARAWVLGALESLGVPASEVTLEVEGVPLSTDGAWWRIEVRAQPRQDLALRLFGESLPWSAHQPLQLFHSHRFTPAALRERLKKARLGPIAAWEGAEGEEGISLCRAIP